VEQERRKNRKIRRKPVRHSTRKRGSDSNLNAWMLECIGIKGLNMLGDYAISNGEGVVVALTGIAEKIGQYGRHQNLRNRNGGKSAGEDGLASTIDDLVSTIAVG